MGTQDSAHGLGEQIAGMWRQMGDLMVRTQAHNDARFDRLDADVAGLKLDVAGLKSDVAGLKTDVAGLKSDVAGLKTDVAELKIYSVGTREQLNRMELAHAQFENRVDAQFERLFAYIERDETRG